MRTSIRNVLLCLLSSVVSMPLFAIKIMLSEKQSALQEKSEPAPVVAKLPEMISHPIADFVTALKTDGSEPLACIKKLEKHHLDQLYNDMTPLMSAVVACNTNAVKTLLEKGANPNIINKKGITALVCALDATVKNEDAGKKMVHLLVAHKAVPETTQRKGVSALKHGQKVLADGPAKKDIMKTLYLANAIHNASEGASAKLKQDLVNLTKEDINTFLPIKSSIGNLNPLLAAVTTEQQLLTPRIIKNKIEVANMLLGKGADCDARNNKGVCPLDIVIKHNSVIYSRPMLKMMLSKVSPDKKDAHGKTILTRVIENAPFNNLEDLIQVMAEKKADINLCDNEGTSPLMHLLLRGNKKTMKAEDWSTQAMHVCKSVELLKKHNVNCAYECKGKTAYTLAQNIMPESSANKAILNALDPKKQTPTHTISSLVQAILKKQAISDESLAQLTTVNEIDPKTNMTPLMAAVHKGNIEAVQKLISLKADPNMQNSKGVSPLGLIIENMSCGSASIPLAQALSIIQPLMQAGANPTEPTIRGKSAIQYARSRLRRPETRQALLDEFNKKANAMKTAHN